MSTTINQRLLEIQRELKVPKSQYNAYSDFNYRSKEDILEAVKPLCHERGLIPICDDSIECLSNGWAYIKAEAYLVDVETSERSLVAKGYAREIAEKKKMDASQLTGTASSYAGKRALGNLFALDDTVDSDGIQEQTVSIPTAGPFNAHCKSCGTRYQFASKEQYEAFTANPGCCPSPVWEVE